MADYQPIDYRLRCHTKRTDLPVDVLRDIGEAYAEIEQLRKDRDEARREVCSMNETGLRMNESDKKREAKRRGWDCFKESTNA
jgi:hypothetical protein